MGTQAWVSVGQWTLVSSMDTVSGTMETGWVSVGGSLVLYEHSAEQCETGWASVGWTLVLS